MLSSRRSRPIAPPPSSPRISPDPSLDFPTESDLYPGLQTERRSPKKRLARIRPSSTERLTLFAIGIAMLAGVVLFVVRYVPEAASAENLAAPPRPVVISESTATLTSTPDDADVYIDGVHAGRTPISLRLPVGVRLAELRRGEASSRAPLNIEAGKITAQHVDFAGTPLTGALEIGSDPPGARVSVDGTPRGQTPLKIPELTPGQHRVRISSGRTSVERTVVVTSGGSATVVVVWKAEPPPATPNVPQRAASFLPPADVPNSAIYTALDRDVTPPVELERPIPAWSPPEQLASRWFRGVVQVIVDERGSVESAQLVQSLADFYDPGLLGAARSWRFKPALRADQPVRYRKIVEITMNPRQ